MSSPPPQQLRQRNPSKKNKGTASASSEDEYLTKVHKATVAPAATASKYYNLSLGIVTILAFVSRFWKISHPNEVVFDEVHFGKFASYYLQRTYFFDVHPPFAKLLFALMGWFVGFDGHFLFENIGDNYIDNKVPYVAFRAMPAMLGALTVPVVFQIMRESGYTLPACLTAAALVLFDNAHIGQTRLILLDATLIFSMAVSMLCYVRYYKLRHSPFTRKWWKWLVLTGISLSCVISTKYVGVFTFFTIGSAVAIDLWNLLDIKRGLTLTEFGKHFAARATGLIVVPFLFYLFWFQVHFTILSRSGPGDDFMTPQFQETLSDNLMTLSSMPIHYYDAITLRHKETKAYLHSHPDKYPLRYDDGRISSQGQQVTGYPYNDTNNHWIIQPADASREAELRGKPVTNNAVVKLHHLLTNTDLLTHDVASPYFPTNQEFTTATMEDSTGPRHNDTLFEIRIENANDNTEFRTMSGHFKLVHVPTKVAMWTQTKPLPEWAFKQQEINGNKNLQQTSNIWFVEDIPSLSPEDKRATPAPKVVKSMPFLKKYLELQAAMFRHNNALTSSHPYASVPIQWPFVLRGVSFWTKNDTREQIYFIGNPLGWWIASSLLAVYLGIVGADQLTRRRGFDALDNKTRARLYNSTGFFFLAWAAHYLPFYLMGRQLFLHHYLPAHIASALVTGSLLEFIFCPDLIEGPEAERRKKADQVAIAKGAVPSAGPVVETTWASWMAFLVILAILVGCFAFFAPLTYGAPGLNVEQVIRRKWMGYDLHFAK